ncbi:hypothetical protein AB0M20_24755, partial [Actinoplanes sp. NPDC051633]|uniref:hypothetical protein n=1 Tax=Actinoplanes sp. NPDC051633 TaxID=3155670 RepID=UPI00341439AA
GPAANIAPRDLPVALAGPPPATTVVAAKLAAEHPGAFEITQVPDAAAADDLIRDRSVYGAIVVTPAGAEAHVASAAGPVVAQLLGQAAGGGKVVDVVPTYSGDPRGTGFGAGFLPLAITSLLAGVLLFFAARTRAARLAGLSTFAVVAGLAGAGVMQGWLDVLPGDYLTVAGVLALFALAVSGAMTGLAALLDRGGLALGAAILFLVGNALSAVASAPELLPQPWGEVGQWLPIGAGATLLRSVVYFDGNGGLTPALVLSTYAVVGLALVAIGRRGTTRRAAEAIPAAATPEHALAR